MVYTQHSYKLTFITVGRGFTYIAFVCFTLISKKLGAIQATIRLIEDSTILILIAIFGFINFECNMCEVYETRQLLFDNFTNISFILFVLSIFTHFVHVLLMPFFFKIYIFNS